MIEQFRRKRFQLTSRLPSRQRLSSAERRRKIQASLDDFKKTMKSSHLNCSPQQQKINHIHQGFSQRANNHNQQFSELKDMSFYPVSHAQQGLLEQRKNIQVNPSNVLVYERSPSEKAKEVSFQMQKPFHHQGPENVSEKLDFTLNENLKKNVKEKDQQIKNQSIQKTPQRNFIATYEKQQSSSLNFQYNESNYGQSSNNSEAIFFTSQFKDYINREKQQKEKFNTIEQKQAETQKEDHAPRYSSRQSELDSEYLKMVDDEDGRKLQHNKSGSLVLSNNQSSLKYSVYESGVQNLINKKLDEELVLQIDHFSLSKMSSFIERFIQKEAKEIMNSLRFFVKLQKFRQKINLKMKQYYFDGFLLYPQVKILELKNDIKTQNYLKEKNLQKMKIIFNEMKKEGKVKEQKIEQFLQQKCLQSKKSIFKVFKMIWYDGKVIRQVDLYYLSKIFTYWKNTAIKEKKKSNAIALKQYAKSIRRQYFYWFIEGVQKIRYEREIIEKAEYMYANTLLNKALEAWKSKCRKQPKFISLTMTSKNFFTENEHHQWLQTRTLDFRQIR